MNNSKCSCNQDNFEDIEHTHSHEKTSILKAFFPAIISAFLLIIAIYFDYKNYEFFNNKIFRLSLYILAYIPVGYGVFSGMIKEFFNKDFLNEFSLMFIASIGAFILGEYPEAVGVMLFYTIGEIFQDMAVKKAKKNITTLINQRPDKATIIKNNIAQIVQAKDIMPGDIIQVKPGEKLALDGILLSEQTSFNAAFLTGESTPKDINKGEKVLAGMINLNNLSLIEVTTKYDDSKLSQIIELIQNASKQKAPTDLFIRKFAKIYTPIVFIIALLIFVVPYFIYSDYNYSNWLNRALIFLVTSCPCALVISIPLGYFGGIGLASKNGILIKGAMYLDALSKVNWIFFDKTGTITKGNFSVRNHEFNTSKYDKNQILDYINIAESNSNHPIAQAIKKFINKEINPTQELEMKEIAGYGVKMNIDNKNILVGNYKLLDKYNISYDSKIKNIIYTVILVAIDNEYIGYIEIADQIKEDAKYSIASLHNLGIKTTILSGDKKEVVEKVSKELNIKNAFGELLPEDKVEKIKEIKSNTNSKIAFCGDGFNDAPAIAISDIGIAMGGLGSDSSIEIADVIIQDDHLSKIPIAIKIGKLTQKTVIQNIILAFSIKLLIMTLGITDHANLIEAIFADVGVALIAILNSAKLLKSNIK